MVDANVRDDVIAIRRKLHREPELSCKEFKTADMVAEYLGKYGIEVHRVGETGVVGVIKGKGDGPVLALRADMDALPLQDEKDVSYASKVDGVMHACGHDAHVAMLMGAARILSDQDIKGEVRFLFQPSEEQPPGGALSLIEAGWLDGVDKVLGIHVWNPLATGRVCINSGPVMAAADRFEITIQGKGGHGAMPHTAVDSVVIGSQLVMSLQTVVSRLIDPIDPAVITVGMFNAGSNFNIIADTATLKGTVRTFDEGVRKNVAGLIEDMTSNVCGQYGAQGKVNYMYGYPPTVNDPALADELRAEVGSLVGEDNLIETRPNMGGEDFAYYSQKVPSVLMFIGCGGDDPENAPAHHHPKFDIDEGALETGVEIWCKLVTSWLS